MSLQKLTEVFCKKDIEYISSCHKKLLQTSKNFDKIHHKQNQLLKEQQKLMQSGKTCYNCLFPIGGWQFQNNGIRIVNIYDELTFLSFRAIFYLCLDLLKNITKDKYQKIIIMVTASHNQPKYNGLKISKLQPCKNLQQNIVIQISNFLNIAPTSIQDLNYFKLIHKQLHHLISEVQFQNLQDKMPKLIVYLAKDVRISSEPVCKSAKQAIQLINSLFKFPPIQIINLGQLSTPTAFSLSQYISTFIDKREIFPTQNEVKLQIHNYFQQILDIFDKTFNLLNTKNNENNQKIILMDFGNGVGQIQFRQRFYNQLQKVDPIYFNKIIIKDSDFSKPNVKCGAEYVYHHYYQNLQLLQKLQQKYNQTNQCREKTVFLFQHQQYDEIYHFDGDCDRIIIELKDRKQMLDGDNLNCLFCMLLKHLLNRIRIKMQRQKDTFIKIQQFYNKIKKVEVVAIGNTSANPPIQLVLKKQKIHFQIASVGINNLVIQMQNRCQNSQEGIVGAFFEPNGHGNFYFSKKVIQLIEGIQKLNLISCQIEIKLILCLNKINKNNTKGYALIDFFNFQLIKKYAHYLQQNGRIENLQDSQWFYQNMIKNNFYLFNKQQVIQKKFDISSILQKNVIFQNQKQGKKQLKYPQEIAQFAQKLNKEYLKSKVFVRRSMTQPLLKITIKGQMASCKQVQVKIQQFFNNWKSEILLNVS